MPWGSSMCVISISFQMSVPEIWNTMIITTLAYSANDRFQKKLIKKNVQRYTRVAWILINNNSNKQHRSVLYIVIIYCVQYKLL